jgi:hypothetical protein
MADSDTKIVITASDQTGPGTQSAAKNLHSLQAESDALANRLRTNLSGNVRNISYQLQDMAVQIGGGTSAMRALSQQLPQMLMGFGAFGAVVGVAAALIPSLVAGFDAAGGSTKTLANTTDDLNKALGEVGATAKSFNLDGVYKEYNDASVAARLATIEQLKFQQAMIESARIANEKKFGETTQGLGGYSTLEKLKGLGGASGSAKLAEDLGVSLDVARELLPVLKGLRDGSADVGLAFTQFGNALLTGNERAVALATGLASIAKSQRDAYAASTALSGALQKMGDGTEKVTIGIAKAAMATDWWLKGMGDIADALKREDDERRKAIDAQAKQNEELNKAVQAGAKIVEDIDKRTASYEKEIEAMEMSKDAILAKEQARLVELKNMALAADGYTEEVQAIERQIDALNRLRGAYGAQDAAKAAKAAADEWQRAADSIQNSLTDALMRGFESGKGWAENFVQTLKNLFGSLVLRPIIQGIVAPVAGGVTSMFSGGASASGGLGGAGNLLGLGGGGWLSGLGDAIFGGGGGAAFGAGFSSPLSTLGSIFSGAGEFAAGGMALASGLGAAVPIIGGALAIASMAGLFDRKGGPKSGGFGSAGAIGALSNSDAGRWFTPNSADAEMQTAVKTTLASYNQMLASLGGKGIAGFALGYDTDPAGTAPNRLHAGAFVGGQSVYDAALGDLGRDDAALTAALETEAKRSLLAALQASELPKQIAAAFNSVAASGASSETIDNLLQFGAAIKAVIDAISGNVVDDAQKMWEQSQRSSVEALRDMGNEVIRLANNVDGSTESMQALGSATADYRQAVLQTLIAIKQISVQVEEMFSATRDSLETFGLDPAAMYDRFRRCCRPRPTRRRSRSCRSGSMRTSTTPSARSTTSARPSSRARCSTTSTASRRWRKSGC